MPCYVLGREEIPSQNGPGMDFLMVNVNIFLLAFFLLTFGMQYLCVLHKMSKIDQMDVLIELKDNNFISIKGTMHFQNCVQSHLVLDVVQILSFFFISIYYFQKEFQFLGLCIQIENICWFRKLENFEVRKRFLKLVLPTVCGSDFNIS